jgi:hypothetical protein
MMIHVRRHLVGTVDTSHNMGTQNNTSEPN